ncbi:hypothetical protein WN943_000929 [Citrus x changshan-huyou]
MVGGGGESIVVREGAARVEDGGSKGVGGAAARW